MHFIKEMKGNRNKIKPNLKLVSLFKLYTRFHLSYLNEQNKAFYISINEFICYIVEVFVLIF